ncbi:MAG: type II secretion system protein GspN [Pseudomonadota bacterium]
MKMSRAEKAIAYISLFSLFGPAILVFGLWYIVISEDLIRSFVESRLEEKSLTLIVDDVTKEGFLAFRMSGVEIRKKEKPLIRLDIFRGHVSLSRLFSFDLVFPFEARIREGTIRGEIEPGRSELRLDAALDNLPLNAISLLSGITGDLGCISGRIACNGSKGEGRFRLEGAECVARLLAKFPVLLPPDTFTVATARLSVTGDTVQIAPANFEGADAYARLKGEVRGGVLDGVAEFKPKKTFLDRNPHLVYMLRAFQVAPLDYRIPVKRINIFS